MSDESEIVAPTTAKLLTPSSTLPMTTQWAQRALLVALLLAHLAVPLLFAIGHHGELIRDAVLSCQLSLWLISLTLLGMRWPGIVSLAIGGALHFSVWFVIYSAGLRGYVFDALVVPGLMLALALIGLRFWGWRGVWKVETTATPPPWQVSIRQLLVVTTAAAVTFAGANWLRQFPGLETSLYWLIVFADGLGIAALSLTAIWAFGTPGSALLKFGVLLLLATALAVCQVFAFRMEDFWHLAVVSSLAYSILLAGTLAIWQLCGWQIVTRQQLSAKSP